MRLGLLALTAAAAAFAADFRSHWNSDIERPWAGPEYWANPLEDWRVRAGRLECIAAGGDRNVFLLTREVAAAPGELSVAVRLGRLEDDKAELGPGFVGFRLGMTGHFKDYRDSAVRGEGLELGMAYDGRLFIGRRGEDGPRVVPPFSDLELRAEAKPAAGANYRLVLGAYDANGRPLAEIARDDIPGDWLAGGVALVCHSGPIEPRTAQRRQLIDPAAGGKHNTTRGGTLRFWFRDWRVAGSKTAARDERAFGPVLFAMHTLHRRTLKLTAQLAPVDGAPDEVALETGSPFKPAARARLDPLSRTATFRLPNWDDTRDTPYRVVYKMNDNAGQPRTYTWSGTIRKDPRDKAVIAAAAFTGNNDLGFPHADIVRHVSWHKPDVLIFTGDQVYERVGEYGIVRSPLAMAALDYLRKWYIFGWEYRDLLKDIPAICLPDDHDVYHGNIWGAGGKKAEGDPPRAQDTGGYVMPAEFVNMVQRTQSSHHPDPPDATPVEQGITVYYSPLLIGGVSFAVIEDRKWKSSPTVAVPAGKIVNGWPQDPAYNAARQGDVQGAVLLGERQERFLESWAADWTGGAWMKSVVSQTIFANVATLPAGSLSDAGTGKLDTAKLGEYIEGDAIVSDHDSNGWPQTPRNRALRLMRKAQAFHIAGDQHLGSTIQYGIDEWNDAPWALCVPSVANVFPRRWFPPAPGRNPLAHSPRNTGEYRDGFGNAMTVHAVSKPMQWGIAPEALTHRAPGYGIVRFHRQSRRIEIANWARWTDPAAPGAKPYAGWPITIHQFDNGLSQARFLLEAVETPGALPPVVQVIDQATKEVAYTLRPAGEKFTPKVWKEGVYTVRVFDPDGKGERVLRDRRARPAR